MINWFNHMYPYGNLHELNLDWVVATVKRGEKDIADFIGINTIKYADPILWNIESQYEANTVVVDGQTGNAYISVKAVPSGVHLNRNEYWTQIYNYSNVVDTLREQIAHNEGNTTTATQPFAVDDLVFVRGLLYKVIAPMIAGDSFVENSNIVKTTIEEELKLISVAIQNEALARTNADSQLQTNIDNEALARTNADSQLQTNIDNEALARGNADSQLQTNIDNEVLARTNADEVIQSKLGDLLDLHTTNKTSIVNAINEVISSKRVITPEDYGAIGDGLTDDTQALIDCVTNSHGKIILLHNTYLISGSITLYSGVKIIGNGAIIKCNYNPSTGTSQTNCLFNLTNCSDVLICGITFNDTHHASTDSMGRYCIIGGTNASNIEISMCNFNDTFAHHVTLFYTSNNIHTHDCFIDSYTYGGFSHVETCNNVYIERNVIKNGKYTGNGNRYAIILCGWDSSSTHTMGNNLNALYNYISDTLGEWEGIDCHGGTHINVVGNFIENVPEPIAIGSAQETSTGNYNSSWVKISDNTIIVDPSNIPSDKFITGIVFGGQFGDITNNYVFTNAIAGINDLNITGITLVDCQYTDVHSNTFINSCKKCIDIVSNFRATNHLYIRNNVFTIVSSAIISTLLFIRSSSQNYYNIHLANNIINSVNQIADCGTIGGSVTVFFDNNIYYSIANYSYGNLVTYVYGDVATTDNIAQLKGVKGKIVHNVDPAVNSPYGWMYVAGNWHSLGNIT